MAKTEFVIIENTLNKGLSEYFKLTKPGGKVDINAKKAMGLQLLNNTINGSPNESVVPPVLTGRLRASASVFVGSEFMKDTSNLSVSGDSPTPNKSYSDNIDTVTVGFNTPYAARMHEQYSEFKPGKFSKRSGDVGEKFLERHITADKEELIKLYGKILDKLTTEESLI